MTNRLKLPYYDLNSWYRRLRSLISWPGVVKITHFKIRKEEIIHFFFTYLDSIKAKSRPKIN